MISGSFGWDGCGSHLVAIQQGPGILPRTATKSMCIWTSHSLCTGVKWHSCSMICFSCRWITLKRLCNQRYFCSYAQQQLHAWGCQAFRSLDSWVFALTAIKLCGWQPPGFHSGPHLPSSLPFFERVPWVESAVKGNFLKMKRGELRELSYVQVWLLETRDSATFNLMSLAALKLQ